MTIILIIMCLIIIFKLLVLLQVSICFRIKYKFHKFFIFTCAMSTYAGYVVENRPCTLAKLCLLDR